MILFLLAVLCPPNAPVAPPEIVGQRFALIEREFQLSEFEPYRMTIVVYKKLEGGCRVYVHCSIGYFYKDMPMFHDNLTEVHIWQEVKRQLKRRYQAEVEMKIFH